MGFRHLRLDDGKLVPIADKTASDLAATSGGVSEISGGYDAYILVGLGFGLFEIGNALERHRLTETPGLALVSQEFVEAAALETLDGSLAARLVRQLRAISSAPIIVIPTPYPDIRAAQDPAAVWSDAQTVARLPLIYERAAERLLAPLEIIRLKQPAETVAGPAFTRSDLSEGSIRGDMRLAHARHDIRHINPTFGAMMLKQALSVLPTDPT